MNKQIQTENAPKAIGPYSQAIQSGSLLFVSGVMPIDPTTNTLVENTIEAQAKQVMKNIDGVLKAAGYTVDDVVKTTCFLSDINNFAAFNEVYGNYFTSAFLGGQQPAYTGYYSFIITVYPVVVANRRSL